MLATGVLKRQLVRATAAASFALGLDDFGEVLEVSRRAYNAQKRVISSHVLPESTVNKRRMSSRIDRCSLAPLPPRLARGSSLVNL